MSGTAERMDGIPPPLKDRNDVEDIWIYGVDLQPPPSGDAPEDQIRNQKIMAYAFCFQGHCYRLAIPAEYHFSGYNRRPAIGCGFGSTTTSTATASGTTTTTTLTGYYMWQIQKTTHVSRIEKRGGSAEDLILDFNLPGRSPASLTYSAKVAIAAGSGKIYE